MMKNSDKIIEALENKHPGSKVTYVHPYPEVLDSLNDEEVNDFVKEIRDAEELDIRTLFESL